MHHLLQAELSNTEKKYRIIQVSADKLQSIHNYKDPSIISSRLKHIFKPKRTQDPTISQSTIERALSHPDYTKYKRQYVQEPLIESPSQLQEIFTILEDSLVKQTAIVQEIHEKCKKSKQTHDDLQNEMLTIIHDIHENLDYYTNKLKDQFRHMKDFNSLTEFLKNQNLELSILPEYLDERKMLHPFMKLMLKQYMITTSFSSLAKRLDMAPKWMSMINNDSFLMQFVERLRCCPDCGVDLVHFSHRVETAFKFQLARPKPLKFFYDVNNPIENFTVRTMTPFLLKRIDKDNANFCHYSRCPHRMKLQSQEKHCKCKKCVTLIQNELNPNKCPCERCVGQSRFKLKDKVSEQFFTDDDGIKHRKIYHIECIREQKQNQYESIIKTRN